MVSMFLHLFLALYLSMGLALLVALICRAHIATRPDADPAPRDSTEARFPQIGRSTP